MSMHSFSHSLVGNAISSFTHVLQHVGDVVHEIYKQEFSAKKGKEENCD